MPYIIHYYSELYHIPISNCPSMVFNLYQEFHKLAEFFMHYHFGYECILG